MSRKDLDMTAPDTSTPPTPNQTLVLLRGLGGAVLGAIAGYVVFRVLLRSNLYGIMIPGALLGLGASLAARGRHSILGIVCGIAAIPLAIWSEWSVMPFIPDKSFTFFLSHVHELPPLHLIMMALGAAAAYWFGQGR